MVRVITMRYSDEGKLPDATEEQLKELQENVVEALEDHPDVEFKGTFANKEGMGICDWEAPSAEAVKEVYEESGAIDVAPSDEVIEVEQILPIE